MTSPEPPKKIRYQSRSVEQPVDRPREAVWPDVVEMLRTQVGPAEELSIEPPWRFAYEMNTEGRAMEYWQSTVLIRDDGPTCHIAWGLVFDPEPTDAALAESEQVLAEMRSHLAAIAG